MKKHLLFAPESGEGGGPGASSVVDPGTPAHSPAAPPAAEKVKLSDVKESDAATLVDLQRELADEKGARKKDQTRIAELEDQIHALKKLPVEDKGKASDQKRSFLDGATFLD